MKNESKHSPADVSQLPGLGVLDEAAAIQPPGPLPLSVMQAADVTAE